MLDDKLLAIVGLIGIAVYAIHCGGPGSYPLVNTIVAAIAGFVTGASVMKRAAAKEEKPDGDSTDGRNVTGDQG